MSEKVSDIDVAAPRFSIRHLLVAAVPVAVAAAAAGLLYRAVQAPAQGRLLVFWATIAALVPAAWWMIRRKEAKYLATALNGNEAVRFVIPVALSSVTGRMPAWMRLLWHFASALVMCALGSAWVVLFSNIPRNRPNLYTDVALAVIVAFATFLAYGAAYRIALTFFERGTTKALLTDDGIVAPGNSVPWRIIHEVRFRNRRRGTLVVWRPYQLAVLLPPREQFDDVAAFVDERIEATSTGSICEEDQSPQQVAAN